MPKKLSDEEIQTLDVARLEVKLLPGELIQLKKLGEELRMSRTELVRNSLALFSWASKEVISGRSFGSFDAKTKVAKEVMIPSLARLAENR